MNTSFNFGTEDTTPPEGPYIVRAGDAVTTWTWGEHPDGVRDWFEAPAYCRPVQYVTRRDAESDVELCAALGRLVLEEGVPGWMVSLAEMGPDLLKDALR